MADEFLGMVTNVKLCRRCGALVPMLAEPVHGGVAPWSLHEDFHDRIDTLLAADDLAAELRERTDG